MGIFEGIKTQIDSLQNTVSDSVQQETVKHDPSPSKANHSLNKFSELRNVPLHSLTSNKETETTTTTTTQDKVSLLELVAPKFLNSNRLFETSQDQQTNTSETNTTPSKQNFLGTAKEFFGNIKSKLSSWIPPLPNTVASFIDNAKQTLNYLVAPLKPLITNGKEAISSLMDLAKTSLAPVLDSLISNQPTEDVRNSSYIGNRSSGATVTGIVETAFGEIIDPKTENYLKADGDKKEFSFYYSESSLRAGLPKTNLHHQLSPQEIAAEVAKGTSTKVPTSNPNENAELIKMAASAGPGLIDKFIGPHANLRQTEATDFATEGADSLLKGPNTKSKKKPS